MSSEFDMKPWEPVFSTFSEEIGLDTASKISPFAKYVP